jgi:RNA polymerase sigma-32 factor
MAFSLVLPSPVGSLDAYIQAVNRFPLLSFDEEQDLARRWRSEGDVEAARKLVVSHLRVVVSIARNYLGYGLPHADLIQEGNVGLMKAVKRFDPDRGVRLVSFAVHWIKAEIHEFIIRNWRLVKVATTKAQRKLFFNLRSLKSSLGTMSGREVEAMAKELDVSPVDVREMETRLSGHDIALEPTWDDGEETFAPIAYLADPHAGPADAIVAAETERRSSENLTRALATLDPRSRAIIEARWLAEGETATLHELAAQFKVSAERVRQIEQKAMQKMRAAFDE